MDYNEEALGTYVVGEPSDEEIAEARLKYPNLYPDNTLPDKDSGSTTERY